MHTVESPAAERPPDALRDAPEASANAIREAMLEAIGELSDEERERLTALDQPSETVRAWRDLIAERAAREREEVVRRELQHESLSAQPQPTRGLHTAAPPSAVPETAAEWTTWVRGSEEPWERSRRQAEFARWLASHPEA